MRKIGGWASLALLAAVGCSSSSSGAGAGAGDAGGDTSIVHFVDAAADADAAVEAGGGACPGTAGPTMVHAGATTCVDSTEVTRKQYGDFLATNPPTSGQVQGCGWNASFTPQVGWPGDPANDGLPVTQVDWCDATAFCAWAGKRLCDPTEFASACTNTPAASCNVAGGPDAAAAGPVAAGSDQGCVSPTGAFDMIGNVQEWWGTCKTGTGDGSQDNCNLGGGSYQAKGVCGTTFIGPRSGAFADLGFRCCGP